MTVSLSFNADADTDIHLHDYGTERGPILALDNPGAWLTISARNSAPLADRLAFARAFAGAATGYLAALERYAAAAQTTDETSAA